MTAQTIISSTGKTRDNQRQRLYDAEQYVRVDGAQMTLAECQAYLDRLGAQSWTNRHWKIRSVPTIEDGRGSPNARYTYWNNTIQMPTWARHEIVLLHEFAHYLAERCQTSCNGPYVRGSLHCSRNASHGWHFAKILLMLVQHQMGKEMHDRLRASFKQHRVRYTKPRSTR